MGIDFLPQVNHGAFWATEESRSHSQNTGDKCSPKCPDIENVLNRSTIQKSNDFWKSTWCTRWTKELSKEKKDNFTRIAMYPHG